MHETDFLDMRARLGFEYKRHSTTANTTKSCSPIYLPMCHRHLCKERQMTRIAPIAQANSCLDSHIWTVMETSEWSQWGRGGRRREGDTHVSPQPSNRAVCLVCLCRSLAARLLAATPSNRANNNVIMFPDSRLIPLLWDFNNSVLFCGRD